MSDTAILAPQPATPFQSVLALMRGNSFILAMFFSLLLIGGDRVALKAGGLTLRVVFPLLMTAGAFLFMQLGGRIKMDRTLCGLFLMLALAGAVSIFNSYDPTKSIGYTIWVLFDFFVIITLCYNLARGAPSRDVLYLWFLIYRIHVALILFELCRNVLHHTATVRPYIWFYETSYLSIFMSAYFGASLYLLLREGRRHLLDFSLSTLSLVVISSATGLIGILLAVALNFLLARQRWKLMTISVVIFALFVTIVWLFFQNTQYYQLMVGFFLSKKFSFELILNRSGNRYIRALVGLDAFFRHPWTGIGIGADATYMSAQPFPAYVMAYMRPWMNLEAGQPFCNIVIEILGTMGIAGFIPFAGIMVYAVLAMIRNARDKLLFDPVAMAFFVGFFCTFLALQLEGTFLRYYLWAPLGLALGVTARRRLELQAAAPVTRESDPL
jgi:O-antigen ligase